jgi:hypothetical protein
MERLDWSRCLHPPQSPDSDELDFSLFGPIKKAVVEGKFRDDKMITRLSKGRKFVFNSPKKYLTKK